MFIKKLFKNTLKETLGFFYYNYYLKYAQTPGNRALIYHAFGTKFKHDTYGFSIDINKFEEHIKYYRDNYKIININEYMNYNIDTLSITIDDGYKDNLDAVEILNKYNIPFTLYVTSSTLDTRDYLSSGDVKSLSDLANCEIASHSHDHVKLETIANDKILFQLSESKKVLENIIGSEISGISYPHGSYNEYTLSILESIGYKYASSSIKGKNNKNTNKYLLRRSEIVQSDSLSVISKKIKGYYDYYAV
ncbi:MAG: polysaccharide deacetylase family protein [Gammaproteobacteria bacterium]|jgi:peptidoglycan/xylan/chitin deacetylase (PgdA/CDA1 family)|nr:polysaccharide deacetylase family protein [Gammaproteobacteria bacterium]MBT4654570.1 polysaccharide deacetylase family protein [Gammaproteobacteria bacterium]MBT5117108.1 polysaccharide deacetylase family protein [Gammaproteobacteria bacterium]MBT5761256.1 polysaccharide deacetylase family protein [Gammaproteobacteria bacterium]MBT7932026.1 polysaccharide deacetylase family protein [Gammaproteobacteria bacterium]